jgi:hypothetical protein
MKIKGRVQFHKAPPWVRFELFSQAYQKHPFSVCSGGASYMIIRPTRAVAQTFFLAPAQMVVQKSLFAAQKSFFDNSLARLHCKSKTRPSGSDSWICWRYASLRIGHEKILIRAQSILFHLLGISASRITAWASEEDLGNSPCRPDNHIRGTS